jgi:CBS domain-containing protein
MLAEQKLQSVADQLAKGVIPPQESVRTFLLWFDVQRRGPRIIREIREVLKRYALKTVPDFEFAYIDGLISFEPSTAATDATNTGIAVADPTYRIGRLESAHRTPIAVTPDSTLEKAVTLLLTNDFSQLPVMVGEREVKGVVSWKTIGSRLALKRDCPKVRDCMEPAHVLPIDDSLFNAIKTIAENDYVLVQANDKRICGIITASDFNEQFRKLAEPFLLVGEIENGLRQMLHGKFTAAELEAAKAPGDDQRSISSVSDLTFGEYQRLVETEERWEKIHLQIDRAEFVTRLNRVREIRNDVMHFDPDGLEGGDLFILREFAQFLKRLRDVGAV